MEMMALVVMALAAYCLYCFAVTEAVQDSDAINITFDLRRFTPEC